MPPGISSLPSTSRSSFQALAKCTTHRWTSERDRNLKRSLYERHEVPEYWLVDTEERSVTSYRLAGASYGPPTVHGDQISFFGATVDLKDVWDRL